MVLWGFVLTAAGCLFGAGGVALAVLQWRSSKRDALRWQSDSATLSRALAETQDKLELLLSSVRQTDEVPVGEVSARRRTARQVEESILRTVGPERPTEIRLLLSDGDGVVGLPAQRVAALTRLIDSGALVLAGPFKIDSSVTRRVDP